LAFLGIGVIAIVAIVLIWIVTLRSIDDQAVEIRERAGQHVRSVAAVLANDLNDERLMIEQSLAIVADAWAKDSDKVDLGSWRKQLSALTAVSDDIFIANERRVIVQGTLPRSIGQAFGSAYATYPNGSLELFDGDGAKLRDGATPADRGPNTTIEVRQSLIYMLRPLDHPAGWMVGASYRSEGLARLFAAASLGHDGLVGMVDLKRGKMDAIVGSAAAHAGRDLTDSELLDQVRKNDSGIWSGRSPIDSVPRIVAYQRLPGREMTVLVSVSLDSAVEPVSGLSIWARAVAAMGSLAVACIAGIFIWTVATVRSARRRERILERAELDLAIARRDLTFAQVRALLSGPEVGALLGGEIDGVARLDAALRLRSWNRRYAEFSRIQLDQSDVGTPIETLLRRQAAAGAFGDAEQAEQEIAVRLTILHTGAQAVAPPVQRGPAGEELTMWVRGVAGGGYAILLTGPENAGLAQLAPLEETEPEPAEETTDW
jgi:PAS domain-containing protein